MLSAFKIPKKNSVSFSIFKPVLPLLPEVLSNVADKEKSGYITMELSTAAGGAGNQEALGLLWWWEPPRVDYFPERHGRSLGPEWHHLPRQQDGYHQDYTQRRDLDHVWSRCCWEEGWTWRNNFGLDHGYGRGGFVRSDYKYFSPQSFGLPEALDEKVP